MQGLSRPETCSRGQRYILCERDMQGGGENIREVQFLTYLPCAGLVMILDHGTKEVVSRRDIFCVSDQVATRRVMDEADGDGKQSQQPCVMVDQTLNRK